MANTDIDEAYKEYAEDAEDAEGARSAADAGGISPLRRKKLMAAAIIAAGVGALLLGVTGWMFLFPHSDTPQILNPEPPAFSELDEALLLAVRNNDAYEVSRLLGAGASFGAKDSTGTSAMKAAVALNRAGIVRQFLELEGGPLLIRADNSYLNYAVVQNRTEIVLDFLKLGIDVNKTDKNGYTPLMYAIDRNLTGVARGLLKAGADINRVDRYGQTPLIQAANVGRPDMISLLLEAGADTEIVSLAGDTAMSVAQRKNRNVIISLLANAGAPLFN
jgi:ankyrin repeat protein